MERISIFDMFKIGVGPSSSHTLGPWRAASQWIASLKNDNIFGNIHSVTVYLYGSLSKTGVGHGTDIAVLLGLSGENPITIDTTLINQKIAKIKDDSILKVNNEFSIPFDYQTNIVFLEEQLPFHANALRFRAELKNGLLKEAIYYSIGGGFVVQDAAFTRPQATIELPYPCDVPEHLLKHCTENDFSIAEMVWKNELSWREASNIKMELLNIWRVMQECIYKGCHTSGVLPGGLSVNRRANSIYKKLLGDNYNNYNSLTEWIEVVKNQRPTFDGMLKWISCFAFAVNEENAAFGRVVTAPTNGAAGVIPTVLMYYLCLSGKKVTENEIVKFLCVAGEIGTFFKKGATISAAMGGCQAEIGVSSAMAAAALCECTGGTPEQALMAAEIAMEHHLGLTCDPVGGLVQIPCIERNSMGAIKAITAAKIALESNPNLAKVSLDKVIKTMWETAQDMNHKYKETAEGGLANHVSVSLVEC
jgi:L-serine dehydratase